MTRQFPDPGNHVTEVEDSQFPTGTIEVCVPEIERRKSHISLVDPAHPLLAVALDCLKDRDRESPSCHELCGCMSTLKASPKYTESVQLSRVNTKTTPSANTENREREIQQFHDLQQQLHTLRDQLHTQNEQLHPKDDQLQEKKQENQQQQEQILGLHTAKDEQLAGKDHQLQQKEAAIAAYQQEIQKLRQSSDQVAVEFQQNLLVKDMIQGLLRQVQELQQQLRLRVGQRREEGEASGAAVRGGSIKLRWRDGGREPSKMYGEVSAVDGSVAYFRAARSKSVFANNSSTNKWSKLPKCP